MHRVRLPVPAHLRAGQPRRRGGRRGSRAPVADGRVRRPGWSTADRATRRYCPGVALIPRGGTSARVPGGEAAHHAPAVSADAQRPDGGDQPGDQPRPGGRPRGRRRPGRPRRTPGPPSGAGRPAVARPFGQALPARARRGLRARRRPLRTAGHPAAARTPDGRRTAGEDRADGRPALDRRRAGGAAPSWPNIPTAWPVCSPSARTEGGPLAAGPGGAVGRGGGARCRWGWRRRDGAGRPVRRRYAGRCTARRPGRCGPEHRRRGPAARTPLRSAPVDGPDGLDELRSEVAALRDALSGLRQEFDALRHGLGE